MGITIGPPAPPGLPLRPLEKGPPDNTVSEQLIPCQWNDVDFPSVSTKTTLTQDLIQHKYWGVDGVRVEPTGASALEIEIRIPFLNNIVPGKGERWPAGDLYPTQFRKFLDAFYNGNKAIGRLMHPELGQLWAYPVSLTFEYDPKTRDGVYVDARWVQTINDDDDKTGTKLFNPSGEVVTTAGIAADQLDASDADIRGLAPDAPTFDTDFGDLFNSIIAPIDQFSIGAALAANKPAQLLNHVTQLGDSLARAKSALTWPAQDNVSRIQNAVADLGNSITSKSKPVLRLTTKTKTTLAGLVAQCPRNTVDDLINLNPSLIGSIEILVGTVVRYYA